MYHSGRAWKSGVQSPHLDAHLCHRQAVGFSQLQFPHQQNVDPDRVGQRTRDLIFVRTVETVEQMLSQPEVSPGGKRLFRLPSPFIFQSALE